MADYTPSTEVVRQAYAYRGTGGVVAQRRAYVFDRWLAQVKADAWDECLQAVAWAQDNGPAHSALAYVRDHNPYQGGTDE